MRRSSIILPALIITLSVAAFRPLPDFSGTWKGILEGMDGDYSLVYTFNVDGNALSGTVVSPTNDTISIVNGKITDADFSFDVTYNDITYHHVCTIANDTMWMKIDGGMGGELTGKLTRSDAN